MSAFKFMNGNVENVILCALGDGDKYGYEIAKEIKNTTETHYEIKQPTLYAYLKRLEQQNLIESYWGVESNGGRRRYYRLTNPGKNEYFKLVETWENRKAEIANEASEITDEDEVEQALEIEEETPERVETASKKRPTNVHDTMFDEQDEIAAKLAALMNGTTAETESIEPETEPEETVQHVYEQVSIEDETATEEPVNEPKYDFVQDSPEDFMEMFDECAKETVIAKAENRDGENYQHVLMNVLGDQLDDMRTYDEALQLENSTTATKPTAPTESTATALNDLADRYAKQGVKMRMYNKAAASYASRTLMPVSKVNCITAWLVYAAAFVTLMIMAVCTQNVVKFGVYAVTLALLIIVPIVFTVIATKDKARKNKPNFNYKFCITLSSIVAGVVILLSFAISTLAKIEFSNAGTVITHIVLPTIIALLLPLTIVIYNALYKKY